jgi:hypothetical protein
LAGSLSLGREGSPRRVRKVKGSPVRLNPSWREGRVPYELVPLPARKGLVSAVSLLLSAGKELSASGVVLPIRKRRCLRQVVDDGPANGPEMIDGLSDAGIQKQRLSNSKWTI